MDSEEPRTLADELSDDEDVDAATLVRREENRAQAMRAMHAMFHGRETPVINATINNYLPDPHGGHGNDRNRDDEARKDHDDAPDAGDANANDKLRHDNKHPNDNRRPKHNRWGRWCLATLLVIVFATLWSPLALRTVGVLEQVGARAPPRLHDRLSRGHSLSVPPWTIIQDEIDTIPLALRRAKGALQRQTASLNSSLFSDAEWKIYSPRIPLWGYDIIQGQLDLARNASAEVDPDKPKFWNRQEARAVFRQYGEDLTGILRTTTDELAAQAYWQSFPLVGHILRRTTWFDEWRRNTVCTLHEANVEMSDKASQLYNHISEKLKPSQSEAINLHSNSSAIFFGNYYKPKNQIQHPGYSLGELATMNPETARKEWFLGGLNLASTNLSTMLRTFQALSSQQVQEYQNARIAARHNYDRLNWQHRYSALQLQKEGCGEYHRKRRHWDRYIAETKRLLENATDNTLMEIFGHSTKDARLAPLLVEALYKLVLGD